MNIIIRLFQPADLAQILPLMAQLGYPTILAEIQVRFSNYIALDGYGVYVAVKNELIIGFVAFSKSLLIVSDQVRIRIGAIIVDENYRGLGVGKQLMNKVEEQAKQYKPSAFIELTTGTRRKKDGSYEFYKSLGYANEGDMAKLYLRKDL